MKIHNSLFLSKANLNGSKKKNTIFIMMILSVIAVTVLSGFLNIVNDILQQNKDSLLLRQITVFPETKYPESSYKGVNEKNISEVLGIQHVRSCEPEPYESRQYVKFSKITDENGKDISNNDDTYNLYRMAEGGLRQEVDSEYSVISIKGKQLKNSAVMTCIVPDIGYVWNGGTERFDEIGTEWLYGKTINLEYKYCINHYSKNGSNGAQIGGYFKGDPNITDISYDLKVVGVYHYTNESSLSGRPSIIISPETARIIENMAIKKVSQEKPNSLSEYINEPYSRKQIVTVDSYENVSSVEQKLNDLGYLAMSDGMIDPTQLIFSSLFSGGGTFLLVAIILLTVINLFLSVYSNINERKSEIGLMKAIGYKSSQIFISMYIENVILAVRAIIAGGLVSTAIVLGVNLLNANSGDLIRMSYVMPWSQFGILLLVAFAIILIIPLICQLVMTALITRVQPQEAMNS
ncbi:MAG: ABC transporter permease [Acutalibacteraceae bacterium]